MNTTTHPVPISYDDLKAAALVKIFQLADLLSIPPKEAARIYLATAAKKKGGEK